MSGSVNKVILIGNIGKDPEVRHSADGRKIVNLSLATSESWKDKAGTKQEKTEWHRVVIFNQALADVAERFIKKGSKVYVEGALQTRKWTNNTGVEKYTTEVVLGNYSGELTLLDSKGSQNQAPDYPSSGEGSDSSSSSSGWDTKPSSSSSFDDEIPF